MNLFAQIVAEDLKLSLQKKIKELWREAQSAIEDKSLYYAVQEFIDLQEEIEEWVKEQPFLTPLLDELDELGDYIDHLGENQ